MTRPAVRAGDNADGPQVNGRPSLDVGATDYSRRQSAQLPFVRLMTGWLRFVHCGPRTGTLTSSPLKDEAGTQTYIR